MKVILTKDLPDVGRAGTVLKVAPGYARNFLLPRRLAVQATEGNMAQLQLQRGRAEELAARDRDEAEQLAAELSRVELSFTLKAGELGQLYGSVSAADIAEQLAEKGFTIERRKVLLREHIKRTGSIPVEIRVHGDIQAKIRVIVEAEEPPEDEKKKAAEAAAEAEGAPPEDETAAEPAAEDTEETQETPVEEAPEGAESDAEVK